MPSASRIKGRLVHGGLLLVPVMVHGQDFEFLIDTGAAYTALSKEIVSLVRISLDPHRTLLIAPAQGRVFKAPILTILELRMGGIRLVNILAVVLAFPPELRLDGVVGVNVLRRFRMTIEADTGTLILRHLTGKGP